MKTHASSLVESARKFWRRVLGGPLIADVPDELSACEFDCKVGQCSHGEWAACERRRQVALELHSIRRPGREAPGSSEADDRRPS